MAAPANKVAASGFAIPAPVTAASPKMAIKAIPITARMSALKKFCVLGSDTASSSVQSVFKSNAGGLSVNDRPRQECFCQSRLIVTRSDADYTYFRDPSKVLRNIFRRMALRFLAIYYRFSIIFN